MYNKLAYSVPDNFFLPSLSCNFLHWKTELHPCAVALVKVVLDYRKAFYCMERADPMLSNLCWSWGGPYVRDCLDCIWQKKLHISLFFIPYYCRVKKIISKYFINFMAFSWSSWSYNCIQSQIKHLHYFCIIFLVFQPSILIMEGWN